MNKYKISIIVPVFNTEKYLEKCLECLINQTYNNIEIICINDQSTDNSLSILNYYAQKDGRISIIDQKNAGVSIARNVGIFRSTGDYIMFLDSDDWIELNTCEIAIDASLKYAADVVMWSYIKEYPYLSKRKKIFNENTIVFNSRDLVKDIHKRFFGLVGKELKQPENADAIVTVWGKLYRSNIIKYHNTRFVDLNLIGSLEDALFNIDVFQSVSSAVFIHEYLNHYRKDNQDSLTTKYRENLFVQWINLYGMMAEKIKLYSLDDSYSKALSNRIAFSIIGLGLNELSNHTSSRDKVKVIKDILKYPLYRETYKSFNLSYLPIHWKIFFLCAKYKQTFAMYLLLLTIKKNLGR